MTDREAIEQILSICEPVTVGAKDLPAAVTLLRTRAERNDAARHFAELRVLALEKALAIFSGKSESLGQEVVRLKDESEVREIELRYRQHRIDKLEARVKRFCASARRRRKERRNVKTR